MLSRVYRLLFYFGLFIQPFIFWPRAAVPYEIPRVWFIERWIEAVSVIGLLLFLSRPQKQNIYLRLAILVAAFLLIAVIASFNSWPQSFWGNYYRADGLIVLIHFVVLFLIMGLNKRVLKPAAIIKTIGVSSLIISFWVILENFRLLVLHQPVPNWYGVAGVSFNQPVFLAGWLAVTLPAVFALAGPAGLIVQILAIGLTRAWGGILGVLVFAVARSLIAKNKKRSLTAFILLILVFMVVGLMFKTHNYLESGNWVKTVEARERIAAKGLLAWQRRPVFGWGWSNFGAAFTAVDWPEKFLIDAYVDKAHSNLLEVLVTTGAAGLVLYILIVAAVYKKLTGDYLLILVLFLIHSQTNVISVSEELLFWIMLGLAL